MTTTDDRTRPRVEGERQGQIYAATLQLLGEVGYDRLTMDAVAGAARASKATLYRRWSTKGELVVDAVSSAACVPSPDLVDTGSRRGDLLHLACDEGGFADALPMTVMLALATALHREPGLRADFEARFLAPRLALTRSLFERAAERGELGDGADVELLAHVLPGLVVHRVFVLGEPPTPDFVERVVDEVLLPACRAETSRG